MPVVAQGVDYAFSHPSIASLVANGKSFAVRYLFPFSQNPGTKNLTRGEADQLNAALTHGVVSNYESYAERAAEGFAAGVADARAADAQHRACGGPPTRPIYFSVDFDPVASQYPGIGDYFRGVISVIGLARTGAYGSYNMIKWLFDHHLIVWGWQTYAWSAGQYDERCQLSQDKNGVPMGGGEVDLDAAHAEDFGQWKYKGDGDDMSAADVAAINKHTDEKIAALQSRLDHQFTLVYYGDSKYAALGIPDPATGKVPPQGHPWNITDNQQVGLEAIEKAKTAILAAIAAKNLPPLTPEQIAELGKVMAAATSAVQPAGYVGEIKMVPQKSG